MGEVGCYVAFPEVRTAILIVTAIVIVAIWGAVVIAQMVSDRRRRLAVAPTLSGDEVVGSPVTPFTVFYRNATGEGGFVCRACRIRQRDVFPRLRDVCAVAAQHLTECQRMGGQRAIEGRAVIDGVINPIVLREGLMVLAVDSDMRVAPQRLRGVA